MTRTRMEERTEILENNMVTLKADVGTMKDVVLEIREWIRRKEETEETPPRARWGGEASAGRRVEDAVRVDDCTEMQYRKLELPLFSGDDPHGWTFRVERYFRVNRLPESEKVPAATVCLEGKALNWFQWADSRLPMESWLQFKNAVLRRFGSSQMAVGYEGLMALQQEGTVADFRERFELLAAPLGDATEEVLKGAFINGLKKEVKAEVRLMRPNSLCEVMESASQVEERNQVLNEAQVESWRWANSLGLPKLTGLEKPHGPDKVHGLDRWKSGGDKSWRSTNSNPYNRPDSGKDSNRVAPVTYGRPVEKQKETGGVRREPFRRLSREEEQSKREKGLCFRCDEPFHPGHHCKN